MDTNLRGLSSEMMESTIKCPQRLGWKTREKAEAIATEPATGKGAQGDLGKPPSRWTSEARNWQPEQRNTQTPRHLTVAKESAVASDRKTPAARTERTGKRPGDIRPNLGSCVSPRPIKPEFCENLWPGRRKTPRRQARREQRAQGRQGSKP